MPQPEDASSPNLLTKAQRARKESWVKNSCKASGSPIERNFLHWLLNPKSDLFMVNGSFFFKSSRIAHTTLTACAITVASAAPAASICKPATKTRSPMILTIHATRTKRSGDLLSPNPRKIAAKRLYATIKKIPQPHIRT